MVFKWPGSSVKCTLRPAIMCRDGEFWAECWGECFGDPGNCLAPRVTLSRGLRDLELTWRLLWARHFPCLSPSVAGCNWFIPRRWFIVIRDSERARVNWYKNHQGPGHALWDSVHSDITAQNNHKWNFETLIQDQDKFRIIIISKMPFCVKARTAGSRSPLPIMMIWNQFRRGTGYLTEFWVILYNRNKYKCAQKGLFSCCASAVHLKSLHLMTDDFGMMTYWKVMKVMMHILRMSKQ